MRFENDPGGPLVGIPHYRGPGPDGSSSLYDIELINRYGSWHYFGYTYPGETCWPLAFYGEQAQFSIPPETLPTAGLIAPYQTMVFRNVRLYEGDRFALCGTDITGDFGGGQAKAALLSVYLVDLLSLGALGFPAATNTATANWDGTNVLDLLGELLQVDEFQYRFGSAYTGIFAEFSSAALDGSWWGVAVAAFDFVHTVASDWKEAAFAVLMRFEGVPARVDFLDKFIRYGEFFSFLMNAGPLFEMAFALEIGALEAPWGYVGFYTEPSLAQDTTLPSGAIDAPAERATVGNSVAVRGSAFDDCSGVQQVKLTWTVDGWQTWTVAGIDTSSPYEIVADLSALADGTDVTFGWDITDGAGNEARSPLGNRTVTKDAAALLPPSNGLTFVSDVNYPDGASVQPGATFTKTWRVRNSGTTAWDGTQTLFWLSGERMGGPEDGVVLPSLSPGTEGDVSVTFQAPEGGGGHISYWRPRSATGDFGDVLWVLIEVQCEGGTCDGCADDGFEPNESRTAAGAVAAGAYTDLRICAGDEDWFSLDVPAGRAASVRIDFTHEAGDLDLELYDALGTRVAWSNGTTNSESFTYTPTGSGTFYARVLGYDGATNSYRATFDLPAAPSSGLVVTSSLAISPDAPSTIGQELGATFEIQNLGDATVVLDRLVVGGRGPGGDGDIQDFTHRLGVSIAPGASYQYTGVYTPRVTGTYRFYVAYLVDGEWHEAAGGSGVTVQRFVTVGEADGGDVLVERICVGTGPNEGTCASSFPTNQQPGGFLRLSNLQSGELRVQFIYRDLVAQSDVDSNVMVRTVTSSVIEIWDPSASFPGPGAYRLWVKIANNGTYHQHEVPVTFTYGDVTYLEGRPYKGDEEPDVCRYSQGRCVELDNMTVYRFYYPGDATGSQIITLPQDQYDILAATSPCRLGGDYVSTPKGCIHHDSTMSAPFDHFIRVRDDARRMTSGTAHGCFFDPSLIVETPGFSALFDFMDTPSDPTYCDPTIPMSEESCGSCATRLRGCDPERCYLTVTDCAYACTADEECVDGLCQTVPELEAGTLVEPTDGSTVPNPEFTVSWVSGQSSRGEPTQSALYCSRDGAPWQLEYGYGTDEVGVIHETVPGSTVVCKLRTRLRDYHETWIDSSTATFHVSDDYPRMVVSRIALSLPDDFTACEDFRALADIENVGGRWGDWRASAYLHPTGEHYFSSYSVEAHHAAYPSLIPGAQETFEFLFQPGFSLPVAPGEWEVTVVVEDYAEGHGEPAVASAAVSAVDDGGPEIQKFVVHGFGGDAAGVLPGKTHLVEIEAHDGYQLTRWELAWDAGAGWEPIATSPDFGDAACLTRYRDWAEWTAPETLSVGATVEVRFRVWDAADQQDTAVAELTVVESVAPEVAFAKPAGGETYPKFTVEDRSCVEVDFVVAAATELRSLEIGFANHDRTIHKSMMTVSPVPADGHVSACLYAQHAGDNLAAYVRTRDEFSQRSYFYSPAFRVDILPAGAPFALPLVQPDVEPCRVPADIDSAAVESRYAGRPSRTESLRVLKTCRATFSDVNLGTLVESEMEVLSLTFDGSALLSEDVGLAPLREPSGVGPVHFDAATYDPWYYAYQTTEAPSCPDPFNAPCDHEVSLREVVAGNATPWFALAEYSETGSPELQHGYLAALLSPAGARLLLVRHALLADRRTDLYRNDGVAWAFVTEYVPPLGGAFVSGESLWAIQIADIAGEGSQRVAALRIDDDTGAILEDVELATLSTSSLQWSAGRDVSAGSATVVMLDRAALTLSGARLVGGDWRTYPATPLPNTRRGVGVTDAWLVGVLSTGGRAYVELKLWRDGHGTENVAIEYLPGEALQFDSAVAISRPLVGAFAGRSDGSLYLADRCEWNLEDGHLCLQLGHPEFTDCYDGDICTADTHQCSLSAQKSPI